MDMSLSKGADRREVLLSTGMGGVNSHRAYVTSRQAQRYGLAN